MGREKPNAEADWLTDWLSTRTRRSISYLTDTRVVEIEEIASSEQRVCEDVRMRMPLRLRASCWMCYRRALAKSPIFLGTYCKSNYVPIIAQRQVLFVG